VLVGINIYLFIKYTIIEDINITKVTDKPIPTAFFSLFDVPKKGQIPKNLVNIMFSANKEVKNNATKFILSPPYFL
jgi:hypothetical protein